MPSGSGFRVFGSIRELCEDTSASSIQERLDRRCPPQHVLTHVSVRKRHTCLSPQRIERGERNTTALGDLPPRHVLVDLNGFDFGSLIHKFSCVAHPSLPSLLRNGPVARPAIHEQLEPL